MKRKNVAETAEPSCLVGNPDQPTKQTSTQKVYVTGWETTGGVQFADSLRFPLAFNPSTQLFWGWENSNE